MKNNIIAVVFYNPADVGEQAWEFIEYLEKHGSPKKDGYICDLATYTSHHNMQIHLDLGVNHYVRFAQKDDNGLYQFIN